ncbi:hypothetical protein Tsubulata_006580 [Turnera subulata]|uniref:Zinc knuckle CX2CX4HX4C domain-containing protein n=1 Tax=Turnera subulata TaxID=218843 RepID=A0A9Q0G029_9ROSI|nr:hypothetical protein Tsubulata_006580 [Turnera subulata]
MEAGILRKGDTGEEETERAVVVSSDEDDEVLELEEVKDDLQVHNSFCLLARVLGSKHVNPQAFSNLMGKVWNPMKGFLKEITGDEVLAQVEVAEVPIWVQISNVPPNQRSRISVISIASRVGNFLRFDDKGEQGWGKFIRARVNMQVDRPIRKSLTIRKGKGEKVAVIFRYEGLPNFCYLCGKMDHQLKECDRRSEESDDEEQVNFGEWLRASPRKPF